jgi:regulator of replication initiation timing
MGKIKGDTPMPKQTEFADLLRSKLGAESKGQWLEFMDYIESRLSFLLQSAGRPTREQIESSIIGLAGFDSWSDMVEYSPAYGGLGWSIDSWKSWKKAYRVVQEHEYLRSLDMTASEINTISRQCKPFPLTEIELRAFQEGRKKDLEEKRGNSLAGLQNQISALSSELDEATHQLATSRKGEAELKTELETSRDRLLKAQSATGVAEGKAETLKAQVEDLGKKVSTLERQLEAANGETSRAEARAKHFASMSRWEHLKLAFGSSLPIPPVSAKKPARPKKKGA